MKKKNQIIIAIIIVGFSIIVGYLIYKYTLFNNEDKNNLDQVEENRLESDEPIGLQKYRERNGIKSPKEEREEEIKERESELQKELDAESQTIIK